MTLAERAGVRLRTTSAAPLQGGTLVLPHARLFAWRTHGCLGTSRAAEHSAATAIVSLDGLGISFVLRALSLSQHLHASAAALLPGELARMRAGCHLTAARYMPACHFPLYLLLLPLICTSAYWLVRTRGAHLHLALLAATVLLRHSRAHHGDLPGCLKFRGGGHSSR
jgi:hypothetical protein